MSRKRKSRFDGDYGDRPADRDRKRPRDAGSRSESREERGRDTRSDDEEYSRGSGRHRRGKHGSDRLHNRGTKRRLD